MFNEDWVVRNSLHDLYEIVCRLENKLIEKGVLTQDEKIEIDIGHKPMHIVKLKDKGWIRCGSVQRVIIQIMNGSLNVHIVGEVVNQKRDGKLKDKGVK